MQLQVGLLAVVIRFTETVLGFMGMLFFFCLCAIYEMYRLKEEPFSCISAIFLAHVKIMPAIFLQFCFDVSRFGRMVACFRYASIDVHSVYLPPSKLEFNYDNQEWIQKEANEVQQLLTLVLFLAKSFVHTNT